MHPLIAEVQKSQLKRVPQIKTGYTVRVHQKIKEGNKERVQVFEGLVIKMGHGQGVERTITVRKMVSGIGVEKIFPIHSPNIVKIEVKKKAKVRRAKLYYMRERSGKSARLKERHVSDEERAAEEARMDALIEEAVEAKAAEEAKAEQAVEAEAVTTEAATEEKTPEAPAEEVPAETPAEEVAEEKIEEKTEEAPEPAAEEAPAQEATEEVKEEAPKEDSEEK